MLFCHLLHLAVRCKLAATPQVKCWGAAGKHGVQGFPTLKLFLQGQDGRPRAVDYTGARQAAAVVDWALDQVKRDALSRIGAGAGGAPLRVRLRSGCILQTPSAHEYAKIAGVHCWIQHVCL